MIFIPAGDFLMGNNDGEDGEKPQHTVHLDGYWIYTTPITVAQYRTFCAASKKHMPDAPPWGWKEDHPVVQVSWDEAASYAKWAGVKLPTEAQWEKAARGTDGRNYPWGNTWDADRCANSVLPNKTTGTTAVAGYPQGASPYGVMDMAGNVWQWCGDWWSGDYYKTAPVHNPRGPETGANHALRGGSWNTLHKEDFHTSLRHLDSPEARSDYYGFRCVSEQ